MQGCNAGRYICIMKCTQMHQLLYEIVPFNSKLYKRFPDCCAELVLSDLPFLGDIVLLCIREYSFFKSFFWHHFLMSQWKKVICCWYEFHMSINLCLPKFGSPRKHFDQRGSLATSSSSTEKTNVFLSHLRRLISPSLTNEPLLQIWLEGGTPVTLARDTGPLSFSICEQILVLLQSWITFYLFQSHAIFHYSAECT